MQAGDSFLSASAAAAARPPTIRQRRRSIFSSCRHGCSDYSQARRCTSSKQQAEACERAHSPSVFNPNAAGAVSRAIVERSHTNQSKARARTRRRPTKNHSCARARDVSTIFNIFASKTRVVRSHDDRRCTWAHARARRSSLVLVM